MSQTMSTPRPVTEYGDTPVGELAIAFALAEARLEVVEQLSRAAARSSPEVHDQHADFVSICEKMSTDLLCQMLDISERARRISAKSIADLAAKSRIWLGRYVPEDDDDVLSLAESICRELVVLEQSAKCSGAGTSGKTA